MLEGFAKEKFIEPALVKINKKICFNHDDESQF